MTDIATTIHSLPLEAIHLPRLPGFWPISWGWWSLLATIIFCIAAMIGAWKWRRNRLKAKKAAIKLLAQDHNISPSNAMEIVRQAALSYYPREKIANLSGASWLAFLDSQMQTPTFHLYEKEWLAALYQKQPTTDHRVQLVSQCNTWLHVSLPPKRRYHG